MQMQNTKDLEYLEGSTRDRMFSYTYSEHTRARLFSVKTPHWQPNLTILENSNRCEPEVMLGFTNKTNFLVGCFMLVLMAVPGALIGPMTIYLPSSNVYVQASWRFQGWTILAIILSLLLYLYKGKEMSIKNDFSVEKMKKSSINSFLIFIWNIGFILGCSLTLTSHADIMYSSAGVYLFLYAVITLQMVHKFEYIGYGMYAIGVYLMFTDPFATKTNMEGQSYIGDLYAFGGAGAWALFNILNEGKMEDLHPMITLTQNYIFWSLFQLLIFPFIVGPSIFFSFDPQLGAFGWLLRGDVFYLLMFKVAPVTGILSNFGFYAAFYYFPIEIVAGTMLTEPFFAQLGGILLGQDEIPGIKTVLGVIVITTGFVFAGLGTSYRKNTKVDTEQDERLEMDDTLYYERLN